MFLIDSFAFHTDTVNGFSFHPFLPMAACSSGHRRFDTLDDSPEDFSLSGISTPLLYLLSCFLFYFFVFFSVFLKITIESGLWVSSVSLFGLCRRWKLCFYLEFRFGFYGGQCYCHGLWGFKQSIWNLELLLGSLTCLRDTTEATWAWSIIQLRSRQRLIRQNSCTFLM